MELPPKPEKRKEKTFVVLGENGHENEYVFTMPYATSDEIPYALTSAITERLAGTGWEVLNRGTRLEIRHAKEFGKREDETVTSTIREILGDRYEVTFLEK
jgi:hypothetical protein